MKILEFEFRGELYQVNELGYIKANGLNYFSKNWIFLGGSHHHFCNRITRHLKDVFNKPDILNGCIGWDKDYGTVRQWGGLYCGKTPRIKRARITQTK